MKTDKPLSFHLVKLCGSSDSLHRIEPLLELAGADAITWLPADPHDHLWEPEPGCNPVWQSGTMSALFYGHKEQADQMVDFLRQLSEAYEIHEIHMEPLPDLEWIDAWHEYARPMQFGSLYVTPWGNDAENSEILPYGDSARLYLPPGMAFGTGQHPSTAMCLQCLSQLQPQWDSKDIMDYGCGSGILGLGALALGARRCFSVDVDPQALIATKSNAERNGLLSRVEIYLADALPQHIQADVVVANILSQTLIDLAPVLVSKMRDDALLILSGLLTRQSSEVIQAYAPWVDLKPVLEQDGWILIAGRKK